MKYTQIKEMQTEELQKKLQEARRELVKLNATVATGSASQSPGKVRTAKKTIARMLTELSVRGTE